MTTTLITGANKGLGFEAGRQLIAAGHTVYLGSRDARRGRLAAEQLGARMVLIDVTEDASVAAAARTIEADGGLDVLVNNAGIEMRNQGNVVPSAADITADLMAHCSRPTSSAWCASLTLSCRCCAGPPPRL
jgi:NAD(P)-dependent dehydrogenase (short-subunit alcohol dehydrogenase family)